MLFRSNDTATTEIYTQFDTLSLHDALPASSGSLLPDPDCSASYVVGIASLDPGALLAIYPREVTALPEPLNPADEIAARLASIVDSSDDVIVSKTLDGTITSWNRAAERILGYTAEEVIGQSINLIIPRDRQAEEVEVMKEIRAGRLVHHFETVRVAKDGRIVHVSLTISPIQDASGRVIGASKIARDISERDRKSTRLNSSHRTVSRMPSSA